MAQRIQLRRTKGWRKPDGAVVVARPSKWGNPWAVRPIENGSLLAHSPFRWSLRHDGYPRAVFVDKVDAIEEAVRRYRLHIEYFASVSDALRLADLTGRDLACWCPLDSPCHADVLLELANAPENQKR